MLLRITIISLAIILSSSIGCSKKFPGTAWEANYESINKTNTEKHKGISVMEFSEKEVKIKNNYRRYNILKDNSFISDDFDSNEFEYSVEGNTIKVKESSLSGNVNYAVYVYKDGKLHSTDGKKVFTEK